MASKPSTEELIIGNIFVSDTFSAKEGAIAPGFPS